MESTYCFEQLFENGVGHEEAAEVLSDYLERGAKVVLRWTKDYNIYSVTLLVSTLEDENEIDDLSHVFGNEELEDSNAFIDEIGVNGAAFSENLETFISCENELLGTFGLDRDDIEKIVHNWELNAND